MPQLQENKTNLGKFPFNFIVSKKFKKSGRVIQPIRIGWGYQRLQMWFLRTKGGRIKDDKNFKTTSSADHSSAANVFQLGHFHKLKDYNQTWVPNRLKCLPLHIVTLW